MFPISGDTYDVRDQLKKLGCSWNEELRAWCAPDEGVRAQGQALADAEPWRKWSGFLDSLAWAPGAFTGTAWEAGLNACSRGIPLRDAMEEIRRRITAAGKSPEAGWVERNVGRAYQHAEPPTAKGMLGAGSREQGKDDAAPVTSAEKVKKPSFDESALQRFSAPWKNAVDTAWLADRSAIDPTSTDADGFLRALFREGEKVVVFDVYKSQGQWLWSHAEGFASGEVDHRAWDGVDREHTSPPPLRAGRAFDARGAAGVWFLSNPVDGEFRAQEEVDKWGRAKWSRRWEPCVRDWRYFVLESDQADAREWMGAIVQLPLPIAALYTSAGKSIHALIELNASSKLEFDEWRQTAIRTLTVLGGDPQTMTAVRLTRLPGCWRLADKDGTEYPHPRLQKLLYLAPSPSATPLCERARVRDSFGPWLRAAEGMLGADAGEIVPEELAGLRRGLGQFRSERAKQLLTELGRLAS